MSIFNNAQQKYPVQSYNIFVDENYHINNTNKSQAHQTFHGEK